ncbi:MAG: type III secretion system stator protein SctL [Thiotrichales bacterium]
MVEEVEHPEPDTIIKSADYKRLAYARFVMEKARTESDRILQEAEHAYARRSAEGYRDGLAEGKLAATEIIVGAVSGAIAGLAQLESALLAVIDEALNKLFSGLDQREIVTAAVRNGLEHVRHSQRITLIANPSTIDDLERGLDFALYKSSIFNLVGDARLSVGECVIEAESATVTIDTAAQLEALKSILRTRISN